MADIGTDLYLAYENGYEAGKKDATQKWISVKERLPEETPTNCLCYSKDGYMVGSYTNWGWMFPCYFGKVTHWMTLPEPPEEGDKDNG